MFAWILPPTTPLIVKCTLYYSSIRYLIEYSIDGETDWLVARNLKKQPIHVTEAYTESILSIAPKPVRYPQRALADLRCRHII